MAPALELRSLFDSCREPRAMKWDPRNVGEFTRQWDSYVQREWVPDTFLSAPSSSKQIEDLHMFVSLPENLYSEPVTIMDFDLVSVDYAHAVCAGIVEKVREWFSTDLPIWQSVRLSKNYFPLTQAGERQRLRASGVKLQRYFFSAALSDAIALSDAMGSWSLLPRQIEVSPAPAEVQTIRILRGKVERVDGDLAYVTLNDERGRETFADCSAAELEGRGISEGQFFECRIEDRSAETVVTIDPIPERRLSRGEWKDLSDRVSESLSGYDLNDDY